MAPLSEETESKEHKFVMAPLCLLQTKTVLIVEQTRGGALAKMLRQVMTMIETMIGFKIKLV